MAKVKRLFKFHKSTTDLSEWNKNDDKLLKAVERGDIGKIDTLLSKKNVLPTKPGPKGLSVFHLSAGSGQLAIVERFLNYGVDVNSIDLLGRTALHLAAKLGWPQMVERLLQMGANQNAEDSDHMTAAHYACGSSHVPCVQILIQHGAQVNGRDKSGRSPLFYCAQSGDLAMCKMLLDHGADVNLSDHAGRTALIFAAGKGHREVCQLLLKRGANTAVRDKDGLTAVEYSIKGGHELQEVFDKAPARASWDVAAGSTETGRNASPSSAENTDIVNRFSVEDSPTTNTKHSAPQSPKGTSSAPSTPKSPHSREATPPSSTTDQRTLDAYKELEEEHELLSEELRVLRVSHIKLQDKLQFMTERAQKSGENGEEGQKLQAMENEFKKLKRLYSAEQAKTSQLEGKVEKLKHRQSTQDTSDSPVTLGQAGSEGATDSWGDSDDELFGNPAEKKPKGEKSDEQLVALLRSQILTLRQENDHLKEKLQTDSGQNSPVVKQEREVHYVNTSLTNGSPDINNLKKEKLDLLHEIETLKEEASTLRQSPLAHSVSVFSEGESGIHMNGERSRTPSEEGDTVPSEEMSAQEECRFLKENIKKMQVAYSSLVEAGDKLQIEYDQQYDEKVLLEDKVQELLREKEELTKENDILAAHNLHEEFEKLFQELEALQEKNKALEKDKAELTKEYARQPHTGSEVTDLSKERDALKVRCQELEEMATQLKQDHNIVIEEIQSVQERYSDVQNERDQVQQEVEVIQDELEKLTQQYELVQQDYNQLEQDYAELLSDKAKLEQDFLNLEVNHSPETLDNGMSIQDQEIIIQQNSILSEEKEVLESKVLELSTAKQLLERELEIAQVKVKNMEVKVSEDRKTSKTSPISTSPKSSSPTPITSEKDKQIRSLQIKISRLQQQVTEMGRKHKDTVNTYRTHLISAVQGHMDPEVQQAIHHIIELRSTEQYC